jgi:hypothetical protein
VKERLDGDSALVVHKALPETFDIIPLRERAIWRDIQGHASDPVRRGVVKAKRCLVALVHTPAVQAIRYKDCLVTHLLPARWSLWTDQQAGCAVAPSLLRILGVHGPCHQL